MYSKVASKTITRDNANQYIASDATVERMLRLHRERKYLANAVPECSNNPPVSNTRNEESTSTEYYMIDCLNKNQNDYNTLNSDVMSFAKNYNQVIRIRNNARKYNGFFTQVKRKNLLKSPEPERTKNDLGLVTIQRRKSHGVNLKFPAIYKKLSTGVAYPEFKEEKRSKSLSRGRKETSKEKYEMKLHTVLNRIKVLN